MQNANNENRKLRTTLSAKITFMFGIIIVIMLIPLVIMLFLSNKYINRYDRVLSNINKINSIQTVTATQPQRILNYCIINKNVAESGEGEQIADMIRYIRDIKYEIGTNDAYAQNLKQAEVVENLLNNYLKNYREGIGLCGECFSLAGDSKFYTMNDISGYLSKNCEVLLNLEMQRSQEMQKSIAKSYSEIRINSIVLFFVVILVAAVLVSVLNKGIAKPVRLLSKKLEIIADKDLTDTEVAVSSNDEIGVLASAFNIMSGNLKEVLEKASSVSDNIEESFHEVTQSVESTTEGSEHIAQTVEYMLEKMDQQNAESRLVMTNIEGISQISYQISQNAQNIRTTAQNAISGANLGARTLKNYTEQLEMVNSVMREITHMVNELSANAQQMTEIVNTIAEISEETNLLSLNASIEAARAGEAGRGFSVVAEQIQKLADSSKDSAEEIGEIIKGVQNRALNMEEEMRQGLAQLEKGNVIAEKAQSSFSDIEKGIKDVDVQVRDIVGNVEHLFNSVSDTSQNMKMIDAAINDTSNVAKEISDTVNNETISLAELTATMENLLQITTDLKETLAEFKL